MKKYGFSLSELLVSILIIGFLSGALISTFNKYDKGIKYLYSNTYYVLDRALYNATTYWIPNNRKDREPFQEEVKYKNPENKEQILTQKIDEKEGAKRLCRALIEYINPVESDDRDSICHAETKVNDMGTDDLFTADNVQFTATNGVRFWISKRYPLKDEEEEEEESGEEEGTKVTGLKFYIIYADLNGKQRPNSMTYEKGSAANKWKTKDPDIFAFAALENGRICPIGVPEVEPRYLTTRIVYEEVVDNDVELKYSSPSRPYVYSKAEAWGYYLPEEMRQGHSEVADDATISEEPLTFNGYVKSRINSDSKIYAFLGNYETLSEYVQKDDYNQDDDGKFNITFKSAAPQHAAGNPHSPNTGGYSCRWMSDEECSVLVDKYVE